MQNPYFAHFAEKSNIENIDFMEKPEYPDSCFLRSRNGENRKSLCGQLFLFLNQKPAVHLLQSGVIISLPLLCGDPVRSPVLILV